VIAPPETIDQGKSNWVSWLVCRELNPSRPDRVRLDRVRSSLDVAVARLAEDFSESDWSDIDRSKALLLGPDRAKNGIAYNSMRLPERLVDHKIFDQFANRFSPAARWFCNWTFDLPWMTSGMGSWDPVTTSTFDLCLGAVDGDLVGIFCVQDED
jgi:hypothetical protein